jgi:hypothetical protein
MVELNQGVKSRLSIKSDAKDINTWDAGWQLALGAKFGPFGVEANYKGV